MPARKLAPDTPRRVSRLIRACLRARAKKRPSSAEVLRRAIERQLGDPSPLDCRAEIANWLWERSVFEVKGAETRMVQKAAPRRRRFPRLRWAAAASVGAALIAAPMMVDLRSLAATSIPDIRLPVRLGGERTAQVRFIAEPWAEVHIDDRAPILTPHPRPIEVDAGSHRVVFVHPVLGRVERVLELEPGERRLVRHVFATEAGPEAK